MNDGTLISDTEGTRLVFERILPHPQTKVWQAIVDPDQRSVWFFAGTRR